VAVPCCNFVSFRVPVARMVREMARSLSGKLRFRVRCKSSTVCEGSFLLEDNSQF